MVNTKNELIYFKLIIFPKYQDHTTSQKGHDRNYFRFVSQIDEDESESKNVCKQDLAALTNLVSTSSGIEKRSISHSLLIIHWAHCMKSTRCRNTCIYSQKLYDFEFEKKTNVVSKIFENKNKSFKLTIPIREIVKTNNLPLRRNFINEKALFLKVARHYA